MRALSSQPLSSSSHSSSSSLSSSSSSSSSSPSSSSLQSPSSRERPSAARQDSGYNSNTQQPEQIKQHGWSDGFSGGKQTLVQGRECEVDTASPTEEEDEQEARAAYELLCWEVAAMGDQQGGQEDNLNSQKY
jgi:hypothetical protein